MGRRGLSKSDCTNCSKKKVTSTLRERGGGGVFVMMTAIMLKLSWSEWFWSHVTVTVTWGGQERDDTWCRITAIFPISNLISINIRKMIELGSRAGGPLSLSLIWKIMAELRRRLMMMMKTCMIHGNTQCYVQSWISSKVVWEKNFKCYKAGREIILILKHLCL